MTSLRTSTWKAKASTIVRLGRSSIHKLSYNIDLTPLLAYSNRNEWILFPFRMSARQVASREEFYTCTYLP